MIYLVGGAPRVGKSILAQQVAAELHIGWISTDVLVELLRVDNREGPPTEWNADPDEIARVAEWFFPYLERFFWGIDSTAESYLVEGVHFLPAQLEQLATRYRLRSVFLGRSQMTLDDFKRFGSGRGYADLPKDLQRQIVDDVPRWSRFVRDEAERVGYPYVDMSADFSSRLGQARSLLTA